MNFLEYSLEWCRGELFEARLIVLFSLIVIICALLFYFFGNTPNAKAMLFPLLVAGILFAAIGGGMLFINPKRMVEFPIAFKSDANKFIQSEKERVEEFIRWYPKTRMVIAVLGVLGILLFLFWASPIGRAIGITLIIIMLATFVVDHFSEERAELYHQKILEAIN